METVYKDEHVTLKREGKHYELEAARPTGSFVRQSVTYNSFSFDVHYVMEATLGFASPPFFSVKKDALSGRLLH